MRDRDLNQRIVVTGMGSVSPLGLNLQESWTRTVDGELGLQFLTKQEPGREVVFAGAPVDGFVCPPYLPNKTLSRLSRFAQFALAASIEAGLDAKVLQTNTEDCLIKPAVVGIPSAEIGAMIGTATGGALYAAEIYKMIERGSDRFHGYSLDALDPNRANNILHLVLGISGPGAAIAAACSSGLEAPLLAAQIMAHSQIDSRFAKATGMFTGGAEAALHNTIGMRAYQGMGVQTKEVEKIEKASRPFNNERGGVAIGDGAVILFLETLESALRRKAVDPSVHIYGEILGGADSTTPNLDAMGQTDRAGVTEVMNDALNNAGVKPEEIDLVVMHGTGTVSDITEAEAAKGVFKENQPAVTDAKSWDAHMQGATGADAFKTALLSIRYGKVPHIRGLETPAVTGLNYVQGETRKMTVRKALVNAFGLGGKNTCVVVGEYAA